MERHSCPVCNSELNFTQSKFFGTINKEDYYWYCRSCIAEIKYPISKVDVNEIVKDIVLEDPKDHYPEELDLLEEYEKIVNGYLDYLS